MSSMRGHTGGNPLAHTFRTAESWETGTVYDVDPSAQLCSVLTDTGKYLSDMNCPAPGQLPRRGDRVSVMHGRGRAMLLPHTPDIFIDAEPRPSSPRLLNGAAIGDADGAYAQGSLRPANNGRQDAPPDLLPGDKVLSNDEGALLGALSGGVAVLRASELAQIIASAANDLIRMMARNLDIMTSGGHVKFKDVGGKTSMELRMGVDVENEGDPSAEAWRIAMDLGAEGDVFGLSVTDSQGRALYKSEIDPEGRAYTQCRRVTYITQEDAEVEVGTNLDVRIQGDAVVETTGRFACVVDSSIDMSTGFDFTVAAGRTASITALDAMYLSAGDVLDQVGGQGVNLTALRGGVDITSAAPGSDINLTSAGGAKLTSAQAAHIGGPNPGLFSVVLHSRLEDFMSQLGRMLDTHVHTSAAPGSPTTPPVVPIYATVGPVLATAKSNFLKTGG
ncbi:MAG: hypothetical protein E6R03_09315 [Hyphomicrobiaceae bacterium]|nr:MAG: hypothetical protein E6R03_09315 [Hyphomicrobiaceae bacterium]